METTHVAIPGNVAAHPATVVRSATAVSGAATTAAAAPKESFEQKVEGDFKHVLSWITGAGKVALQDVIQYTPDAEEIAAILLPGYKTLEASIGNMVVQGCQLLLTGIISAQQKYASDASATGAQKSQDVLTSVGGTVQSILGLAGVGQASEDFVQKLINAIVDILKVRPAPTTAAVAA